MRRFLLYLCCLAAVAGLTILGGFTPRQVLAASIFAGFIAGTLLFWKFRLAFALAGVAVLLAAGVLDLPGVRVFRGRSSCEVNATDSFAVSTLLATS